MDNCSSEQWDDYLIETAVQTKERTSTLEEVRPPDGLPDVFISVTLNVPRTLAFCRMSSHDQKRLYIKLWENMMRSNRPIGWGCSTGYTFEFCKTGHIHLHGYIIYKPNSKFFIQGLIADLVKAYKRSLGKKAYYNDKSYYPEYVRYRDASICMQQETGDRINKWLEYIKKDQ